jgi:exosortase
MSAEGVAAARPASVVAARGSDATAGPSWAIVAFGAAALDPALAESWSALPEMSHGPLLVAFAAWAFFGLRGEVAQDPPQATRLGLLFVAAGALVFPLAWYLQLTFGPRQAVVWLLGVAVLAAAMGLVALRRGLSSLRRLAFPFLFLWLAVPPPGTVFNSLQEWLKALAAASSARVLSASGMQVVREGFVLRLPSGPLLINEACSGIRSLTTLVTFAFVIAFLRRRGLRGGVLLALLAIPVAVVLNVLRIVATAVLQETGRAAEGAAHGALGTAAVGMGVLALLAASCVLPERRARPFAPASLRTPSAPSQWAGAACLVAALVASLGMGRPGETVTSPELSTLPREILGRVGEDGPLDGAWTTLGYDTALRRFYDDGSGTPIRVFVGFWQSRLALGAHDPDRCWPAQGWVFRSAETRHVRPRDGGAPVEVSMRRYFHDGGEWTHLMWAQQGRLVLSAHPGLFESRNVLRVLRDPPETRARLFVLLSFPGATEASASRLEAFASELMAPLYQICPWAAPTRG